MDVTDEAIAEFAEHLIPEAFTTASSASRVELVPDAGRDWLGTWVERCRRDAVTARHPSGAGPGGIIFVQRRDERWRWDLPNPVWPLEPLVERVRADVADFVHPRVFVCSLWARECQRLRAGGNVELETLSWALPWYVEIRRPGGAAVFTGLTDVQGSVVGTTRALPAKTGFERAARGVLLRHPSRRRYRLAAGGGAGSGAS